MKLTTKFFLLLGLFLLYGFGSMAQVSGKKPNIIVILADDMGWGDVGYHGGKFKTPNIDKLSKEGVELNRFYVAAVCSPTRAGLLTGRYPDRFGLRTTVIPPWSKFGVDSSEVFLPELLAQAGYKNRAMLGKWHLGHSNINYHPLKRGFTHYYGHLNGAIDYFSHMREGGLDWHNDFKISKDKGYTTDLLTDEAIRNIKSYNGQSPFFIYLAYNAPHGPLQAKLEDLEQEGYDSSKPVFGNVKGEEVESSTGRGNTQEQTYAAMVANLDTNIGRILKTLDDLKIDDNTLVLFFSDNGPAPHIGGSTAGELRGSKFTEWEGGVRVPAIIRWPNGLKGGRKLEQVMGFVDVMPTLLDLVGVNEKPKNPYDGLNVMPILTGEKQQMDRNFYLGQGAIVNNNWKLIIASDMNPKMKLQEDHLFRIDKDPSEKVNVAKKYPEVYEQLKADLAKYDAIKPKVEVPPYGEGRKGFKAPKNWLIVQ